MSDKIQKISEAFTDPDKLKKPEIQQLVLQTINELDSGKLRVCELIDGEWVVHQWVKQAILLFFKLQPSRRIEAGDLQFFDKIPLKSWDGSEGVRVVPHALVRYGAYVEPGAILMPSYVNLGAYVGSGTMVDTWATVGSCAQIGKNVHLSGGVGIGGVLEPVQAQPVIVEDDCFLGSRVVVVEGVRICRGAVLGAGLTITASTPIIDVTGKEEKSWKGFVPENSVVIPGVRNKVFSAGSYGTPCALIIGKRTESTDRKTSLTSALRDFEVAV